MKALFEEFKLYFVLGFVALMALGVWYVHHDGYKEGVSTADKRVKSANDDRDAANKQAKELASLFNDMNSQALRERNLANERKLRAEKAEQELANFKAQHAKDEKAWNDKLSHSSKKQDCAVLKELLCPSVMDY